MLKAVSQSLIPKSDFFLRRLKSNNRNIEKTEAPNIALSLIAILENLRNDLINSNPIKPINDINRNSSMNLFSENE